MVQFPNYMENKTKKQISYNQIRSQISGQVDIMVWNQIYFQVASQVRDQVWNQVGITNVIQVYFKFKREIDNEK